MIAMLLPTPASAQAAEEETVKLYFHSGTVPLANVDLVASGSTMDTTAPTKAYPSIAWPTNAADGSNPRTIYDGTWLATSDIQLDNHTVKFVWYAAGLDHPSQPSNWDLQLWMSVGGTWTKFAGSIVDMGSLGTGVVKLEATIHNVTTPKGRLVAIVDQAALASSDAAAILLYDSPNYASRIEITPRADSGAPTPTPPVHVAEHLDNATATVQKEFTNATDGSFLYTWNATRNVTGFSYNANLTNGSAQLTVIDHANVTVANLTFNASAAASFNIENATAGNWTIWLNVTQAVGSVGFTLGDEINTSGPDGEPNATTSTGGDNNSAAPQEANGIPAPGVVTLAAGLSLLALALRRRRRTDLE
jgi:hypothetical protein